MAWALSRTMCEKVGEGLCAKCSQDKLREIGCSWWIGPYASSNAKVRKRSNGERTSYAAETEMDARVITSRVRSFLCLSVGTVGSTASMKGQIDPDFIPAVRSSDRIVVDVPDLSRYKVMYMAETDGVKVCAFGCDFGYIMCITDPSLTVFRAWLRKPITTYPGA